MDPCWFHVCSCEVIFKLVHELWRHIKHHHHWNTPFVLKLSKSFLYFFILHMFTYTPTSNPIFFNLRCFKRFKKILYIYQKFLDVWGYRNINSDRCAKKPIFFAKSENWTTVYACCSCKCIIKNECLVCIHSLIYPLNIHITKIVQFHIS